MRAEDRAYLYRLQVQAAALYEVSVEEVQGTSRKARASLPRMAVMYVLRSRAWTITEIGEALLRDHSTIHHGVVRAEQLAKVDSEFAYLVSELAKVPAPSSRIPASDVTAWLREQITSLEEEIAVATRARGALVARLEVIERAHGVLDGMTASVAAARDALAEALLVSPPGADRLGPRSDLDPLAAPAACAGGDTPSAPVVADCGGPTALSAPWGSDRVGIHDDQDTRTEVRTRD